MSFGPPDGEAHAATVALVAGRYTLVSLLGRGGHGEVWEAQDELGGERVALKLFPRDFRAQAARVRREVSALRLLRVPGVVRLLDEGIDQDRPFVVMDLVEGSPFPCDGRARSWAEIADTTISLLEIVV